MQHFFFLSYSSARIFSIAFVLHAIFFFRQALVGIFFQNHPPPPPQELNGRPLRKVRSGALYPGGLQSDVCFDYKRRGLYLGGVGGGGLKAAVYVMILWQRSWQKVRLVFYDRYSVGFTYRIKKCFKLTS